MNDTIKTFRNWTYSWNYYPKHGIEYYQHSKASLLHFPNPRPPPTDNPYSDFHHHKIACFQTSYKWNHTIYFLLFICLIFFVQCDVYKIHQVRVYSNNCYIVFQSIFHNSSLLLIMYFWIVSIWGLSWITLQWTFLSMSLAVRVATFFLDMCPRLELLGHSIHVGSFLVEHIKEFSKWTIYMPTSGVWLSSYSTSSSILWKLVYSRTTLWF